ncbi:hypothetical protein ACH79_16020 [Bradyrhizobium sp. CCBAU 051011]|uniref:hypothetical protein n=1 Tax=Bradyrhizobium sp. CCBAU 051011 TaxID=858422 RepID=UPI001374174E|nr:hypothetical protein [Bradyrhizobium sp. CCBAU 051011]QHO73918.1 hypothetical protein ACH79_16020 [Bradyrhizobium sp. CCBAU 051011]
MATLSDLVTAIATAEGIDAERVGAIARAVREDGFIRTSGRGTSAAQMSEQDAANLLIAANMADTARTASTTVTQYRALKAQRQRTREFGSELEEMIGAAKQERLAHYMMKVVALLGTRRHILGRKLFLDEAYRLDIEFEKPVPSVVLGVWAGSRNDYISFEDRRQQLSAAAGDRRERTRITERTILAVGNVLRT